MNQKEIILNHLKTGKTITNLEALEMYGVGRLSDVILKLRRDGHVISTNDVKTKNRYGKDVIYGAYKLLKIQGEKSEN